MRTEKKLEEDKGRQGLCLGSVSWVNVNLIDASHALWCCGLSSSRLVAVLIREDIGADRQARRGRGGNVDDG